MLPRFSLRNALLLLSAGSLLALIVRAALRQEVWAIGVSIGVGSLVLALLVHAGLYCIACLFRTAVPGPQKVVQPASQLRGDASTTPSDEA
ncbi:MAG: hypothetical protein AAGF31_11230 [Planctomycetota bacterium]